ncbi:MAG TPA: Gfo/Idh/MocA family oxidoreductase [Bryobacteraceae bacterium]|nr:Gfo/Idh/MocA family oxidoreductase [Bryobacteraceae bacterium]
MRSVSRRDLLKGAPALAATALPARVIGANDRIRVGMLGAGARGQYVAAALKTAPGVEIAAVCDVYEPHRAAALESLAVSGAQGYTDHRAILDRKDIDAVLIASPDHWHKDMLLDALAAGKDAYVEKPIAHSIEEGAEMVRAAAASRQVVATGTQQRSWPHYLLGKNIVDSGRLGKVNFVHCYWYQNALAWFRTLPEIDSARLDWKRFLGRAPEQPFSKEKYIAWRHYWNFGGGILTDLFTHWIDVIQWYLGQTEPSAVSVTGKRYHFPWEAPDVMSATFEFPGDFLVTFTGAYNTGVDDGGIEFRGSQATLKIDRTRLLLYPEGARNAIGRQYPEPELEMRAERDGTVDNAANFLACVRSRKMPNANVQAGFEAARTSWLGNRALRRGAA